MIISIISFSANEFLHESFLYKLSEKREKSLSYGSKLNIFGLMVS